MLVWDGFGVGVGSNVLLAATDGTAGRVTDGTVVTTVIVVSGIVVFMPDANSRLLPTEHPSNIDAIPAMAGINSTG